MYRLDNDRQAYFLLVLEMTAVGLSLMNSFNFVPKNEENRVTASTVVMKEFRRQLTLIDLRARFSKYRNTTNWKQKLLSISYIVADNISGMWCACTCSLLYRPPDYEMVYGWPTPH